MSFCFASLGCKIARSIKPFSTSYFRQMSKSSNTELSVEIGRRIRSSPAFCFDVDSTVITKEGIDELAAFKGVGREVAEWTNQAMGGSVLFQDALSARLSIIKPSNEDVSNFLTQHPLQLTPGIEELINTLQEQGRIVYLISGGFRQMIEPVADQLRIPYHRIYANTLLFNESDGSFAGFDEKEPTSRDGGKPAVIQSLIDAHGYSSVVMIGDGATDMQAKPPAKVFIGYGGVIEREKVKEGADWYIYDFEELKELVKSSSY